MCKFHKVASRGVPNIWRYDSLVWSLCTHSTVMSWVFRCIHVGDPSRLEPWKLTGWRVLFGAICDVFCTNGNTHKNDVLLLVHIWYVSAIHVVSISGLNETLLAFWYEHQCIKLWPSRMRELGNFHETSYWLFPTIPKPKTSLKESWPRRDIKLLTNFSARRCNISVMMLSSASDLVKRTDIYLILANRQRSVLDY